MSEHDASGAAAAPASVTPAPAAGAEGKHSGSAAITEQVATLQAQVDKLAHKLEKQKKQKKDKKHASGSSSSSSGAASSSAAAAGAGEKRVDKKDKKKDKKKKKASKADGRHRSGSSSSSHAHGRHGKDKDGGKRDKKKEAEKAAAAAKAEKKAAKAAKAAAEAEAAARKEAKRAKVAATAAEPAAAGAGAGAGVGAAAAAAAGGDGGGGAAAGSSGTATATTSSSRLKIESGKKVAKTLPNSTSLTWTSDSSIDILAGQNFCFPIEIADARPSVLEWTFQTAGGDINFSIAFTRKATKGGKKKKHIAVFPETRVDSYCDEHTQGDAFSGAIDYETALATALTVFYASAGIDKDAESIARAAKIFQKRQDEMVAHLQSKYCKAEDLSKEDAGVRKKALHQLKKDLRRPPHLIHLEQGGCFKIIGSVDVTGPGTVRLVWDNSFSWMRSKQLIFSVKLKARPETSHRTAKK